MLCEVRGWVTGGWPLKGRVMSESGLLNRDSREVVGAPGAKCGYAIAFSGAVPVGGGGYVDDWKNTDRDGEEA